jgi:hypothetical protein
MLCNASDKIPATDMCIVFTAFPTLCHLRSSHGPVAIDATCADLTRPRPGTRLTRDSAEEQDMQIHEATMADVAAIAKVHVESCRTTYKGLLPNDYLANLTYEQREPRWREILSKSVGHSLVYVAEDNAGMDVA